MWHHKDHEKAKRIFLALIAGAGEEFRGRTRLNKAFWYAHLYHYRHHEGLLSRYPIARLPEGPCANDYQYLLSSLEADGDLQVAVDNTSSMHATYVMQACRAPSEIELTDDERDSVQAALNWIHGKSGADVSSESHKLSRGWQKGNDGDVIDVALDALTLEDYEAQRAELEQVDKNLAKAGDLIRDAFGGEDVGRTG